MSLPVVNEVDEGPREVTRIGKFYNFLKRPRENVRLWIYMAVLDPENHRLSVKNLLIGSLMKRISGSL